MDGEIVDKGVTEGLPLTIEEHNRAQSLVDVDAEQLAKGRKSSDRMAADSVQAGNPGPIIEAAQDAIVEHRAQRLGFAFQKTIEIVFGLTDKIGGFQQ